VPGIPGFSSVADREQTASCRSLLRALCSAGDKSLTSRRLGTDLISSLVASGTRVLINILFHKKWAVALLPDVF